MVNCESGGGRVLRVSLHAVALIGGLFLCCCGGLLMLTSKQKLDAGSGWYCYVHDVHVVGIVIGLFIWLLSPKDSSC